MIECKRIKEEGKWLFLTPREYSAASRRISAFCTKTQETASPLFHGWCNFDFDPLSPEAAYCVLRGQDERSPMLERIADDLLPAVEAVGIEEVKVKSATSHVGTEWRLFLPLQVKRGHSGI